MTGPNSQEIRNVEVYLSQLNAVEVTLLSEIRNIKGQLSRKRGPEHSEWRRRARGALGVKRQQHQELINKRIQKNLELKTLRRKTYGEHVFSVALEFIPEDKIPAFKEALKVRDRA